MTEVQSKKPSFLSNLKLKLKYFHNEFQNLTVDDLIQLKWNQKQKLLIIFIERSMYLQEYQTELTDLLERKNRKISKWKEAIASSSSPQDKNSGKIEIEANFRTDLMRLFVHGLEKLQWKRCLEAFSDPLGDLMSNNSLFLEAVDYFLTIELESQGKGSNLTFTDESSTPIAQPSSSSTKRQKGENRAAPASLVKELSTPSMPNSARTEVSYFDDRSSQSNRPPPSSSSNVSSILLNQTPRLQSAIETKIQGQRNDFTLEYVQRLQYQNDLLTKRLKFLEESIRRKEEIEGMMHNLIVDLKASVSQLSDIGGDRKSEASTENKQAKEITKKQNITCPQCKVSFELPSTTGDAVSMTNHSNANGSSNTNWKRLYSKVDGMEREWNEIHTRIRQSVSDKIQHARSRDLENTSNASTTINDLQRDLIELHFNYTKFFSSCTESSADVDDIDEADNDDSQTMNHQLQQFFMQLTFYQKLWMKSQQTLLKIDTLLTSELVDGEATSLVNHDLGKKKNHYSECFDIIQSMMNGRGEKVSKGDFANLLEAIEKVHYEHQLLSRSFTAMSLQFQRLVKYLEVIFKNYEFFSIEKYQFLLENSYESIQEKISLLPKLCEYLDIIEREVRVPNTFKNSSIGGATGGVVNPLDAMARGIFGKELAAVVEILRSNRLNFRQVMDDINDIHKSECEKFLKEQDDFQTIMKNLIKFKTIQTSIKNYYREQLEEIGNSESYNNKGIIKTKGYQSPAVNRQSPKVVKPSSRSKLSPKNNTKDLDERPPFNLSFT